MASKNLTFDPNAGVPYAANLALYSGADFKATFNVVDTSDVAYDFQGLTTTSVWTGSSHAHALRKMGNTCRKRQSRIFLRLEKTCDRVDWTKTNIDRNHCSIKHNCHLCNCDSYWYLFCYASI